MNENKNQTIKQQQWRPKFQTENMLVQIMNFPDKEEKICQL